MRETPFPGAIAAAYIILLIVAGFTVIPFAYMISLSLQTDAEILSGYPVIIPEIPQFKNYIEIWTLAPFGRFFLNSLIMAGGITLAHLILDPMGGYVFAKMEFPFKNVIFILLLSTMMVPHFVRMLPLYIMTAKAGMIDTYPALILPFLSHAYGIFLMRQYIQPIPNELLDAARIDGCSEIRIFWQIVMPQIKPALATVMLVTFIFQWNEFLWPLIVTNSVDMRVMTIGLTLFNQESFTRWNMTATGGLILFLPSLLLFLFTQRYFVQGITLTGMK
jgi:multiple sugar transport system permease protein